MGNCTVTIKKGQGFTPTGTCKIVDIALSSSYATGGDTVPLASLGVGRIQLLQLNSNTTPGGHSVEVIHGALETTAPLLRIRDTATGAQLTNATDNSAQSIRGVVYGDFVHP